MHGENIRNLDISLLAALNALLETGNVTAAAEMLGLSQPAVSHALARLRLLFGDPLLVRSGRQMVATRRALELREPVRSILADVRKLVDPPVFDPAGASGTFHVNAPDATTIVVLGTVLNRISRQAPQLDFVVTNVPTGRFDAMARGEIDLAIDSFASLPAGYHREPLIQDRLVCIARRGHPVVKRGLDIKAYCRWPHANLATASGELLDSHLAEAGIRRRTAITVSNFITAASIVAETDWLLTLPNTVARYIRKLLPVAMLKLPFPFPELSLDQAWHPRAHHDIRHAWLRNQISSIVKGRVA